MGITDPHHHICLNNGARAALRMWEEFLTQFNGSAFFQHMTWINNETLHLYTDAAKSIGYGAICDIEWFYGIWPDEWKQYNITFLELYPIVASPDKKIMRLIRLFVKLCMTYNISLRAEHVPGADNGNFKNFVN